MTATVATSLSAAEPNLSKGSVRMFFSHGNWSVSIVEF